jgi:hypothetical protein
LDRDVRFAALNGLKSDIAACLKCATSGSEAAGNHLYDAERYRSILKSRITAMARSGASGIAGVRKPFELNELRMQRRHDVAVSSLARIPDRFS